MEKRLVIVESPSKSKTIEKYLGEEYKVVSSKGHIRDLATTGKFGLGIEVENDFKTNYIPIKGKSKIITELKKDVKESSFVYLATDPDREGEAISWHLYDALKLNENNYKRVLFNEITKDKVIEAINNPKMIDDNLVSSQETRRILDRIIGFRLSKLMQSKTGGKSAGRVQSVALKLIVDREREIAAFNREEYWTIQAGFNEIEANLFEYMNKKVEIANETEADSIMEKLGNNFSVEKIEEKKKNRKAKYPFITSTLQQEASTKLGFNAKKTMSLAQKLYEGIDLENETVGLITYMRTDSIRLSDEFVGNCYNYIEKTYGKDYIGYVKKGKKSEKDNIQDAHEAIRPSSVYRTPLSLKSYLSNDEYKLYSLIYARCVSSLMKDAVVNQTSVVLNNNDYLFKINGQTLIFDGYLKLYRDYESSEEKILPIYKEKDILVSDYIEKKQHFTEPPARFNEAKLIKELEELGIGRPSTYATIIDTIKERGYVILEDKKFKPTDTGFEITDKLQECFSHIINVEYTANMEKDLDSIAEGDKKSLSVLKPFYEDFENTISKAFDNMEKSAPKETGELCPLCNHPLVYRKGRYGEFIACGNYPECKYVPKVEKEVKAIVKCPLCDEGMMVEKKTKRNKIFYGCNNYPKCKTATWDEPTGELCSICQSLLVKKKDQIVCPSCNKDK